MTDKLVERYVNTAKGIWIPGRVPPHVENGEKVMLSPNTAHSKRRLLLTPEEFNANKIAAKAAKKASRDEKKARDKPAKKISVKGADKVDKKETDS